MKIEPSTDTLDRPDPWRILTRDGTRWVIHARTEQEARCALKEEASRLGLDAHIVEIAPFWKENRDK